MLLTVSARRKFFILSFCFLFSPFFIFFSFSYTIKPIKKLFPSREKPHLCLIFAPLGYESKNIFLADVRVLKQTLTTNFPFSEFQNRIRLFSVEMSAKEQQDVFKEKDTFPYLSVRMDFLESLFNEVEGNFKLLILDYKGSTSTAELSSIEKTSLIILGRQHYRSHALFAKGFLHELGHSLGLRDERISHCPGCENGPPNCAPSKEKAQEWWGDMVGKVAHVRYVQGCCGNRDYVRPTIASLMNDIEKAETFGPVNERYLRNQLEKYLK
jgi:hypothetical protein